MELGFFLPYLAVMAGVTYLIRVIPFVLIRKKIENRFINSFLYYIPYAVLSAMTFPAILYATESPLSACAGLVAAIAAAWCGRSLITVAAAACAAVFAAESLICIL